MYITYTSLVIRCILNCGMNKTSKYNFPLVKRTHNYVVY